MPDSMDLHNKLDACESEIEKLFLLAAYERIDGLVPQYQGLNYRIDFAIPDKMIAIEIDGHDYHKTKEQRTHDNQRERAIKLALPSKWTVIRFTGSEIYQNPSNCVDDVLQFINKKTNTTPHNESLKDNICALFYRCIPRSLIKIWDNVTKLSAVEKEKGLDPKNQGTYQGKYREAVQAYDKVLKIDTNNASASISKGEAPREQDKYYYWTTKALKLWDYNAIYPFDTSTINKENYEEAIRCYNNAIALDPSNTGSYYGKARIYTALSFYARDMHNYKEFDHYCYETIETYKKAAKIDPSDPRYWMEIGYFLNQLDRYEEASNAFDKAIEINQDKKWFHLFIWNGKLTALNGIAGKHQYDADIWYAIGNAFIKRGSDILSMYEATRAYDKAIINRPNFVEAWNGKGLVLKQWSNGRWSVESSIEAAFAMAQGKYDEAIKAYDEAIRLKPDYANTWYNKGLALKDQGNYTDALEYFEKTLELDPENTMAYYAKGIALKSLGITNEANAALAKSGELEKEN
jgi:tetratricopeptide (TPR) repeat protein